MPLWGLWSQQDETFWFSCASESLKARNLATNPNVVVAVDDSVAVVSVEGVASRATGRRDVAEEYAAKYEADLDKAAELVEFVLANEMYVVTPIKAFGVIERADEFSTRATRWVWSPRREEATNKTNP
jgi:hypothetical protein